MTSKLNARCDAPQIRPALPDDRDAIEAVYLAAFPAEEGETVAALAVELLEARTDPDSFALVAESDDGLVGHIAFSPVVLEGDDRFRGVLLAPLAVRPEVQKRGVGTHLIEAGCRRLATQAVEIVFVYGDPAYYGRSGFDAAVAVAFAPPCPLQYPFGWQAKRLTESESPPPSGTLTCVPPLRDPRLW